MLHSLQNPRYRIKYTKTKGITKKIHTIQKHILKATHSMRWKWNFPVPSYGWMRMLICTLAATFIGVPSSCSIQIITRGKKVQCADQTRYRCNIFEL